MNEPCSEWKEYNVPEVYSFAPAAFSAESGTPPTEIPLVWTVRAFHIVSAHLVDDGGDGYCDYEEAPVTGARVQMTPDVGGDTHDLPEVAPGEYSGTVYVAKHYLVTLDDGHKVWTSDALLPVGPFTLTAMATADSLLISWDHTEDNGNRLPLEVTITDGAGNQLYSAKNISDVGTSKFSATAFPTIVASAARVKLTRLGVTMSANVTR